MNWKNRNDNEMRNTFSTRCELTKSKNLIRYVTSQHLMKKMTHLKWFLTSIWKRWWSRNSIMSIRWFIFSQEIRLFWWLIFSLIRTWLNQLLVSSWFMCRIRRDKWSRWNVTFDICDSSRNLRERQKKI